MSVQIGKEPGGCRDVGAVMTDVESTVITSRSMRHSIEAFGLELGNAEGIRGSRRVVIGASENWREGGRIQRHGSI